MEEDEVPEGESGQSLELEDWGGEEEGEEDLGATSLLSTTLTAGKEAYETAHLAERDVEANER